MGCGQQLPIPQELTMTLDPLREAKDVDDILEAHLYNMERAGICYASYEALREAVDGRFD